MVPLVGASLEDAPATERPTPMAAAAERTSTTSGALMRTDRPPSVVLVRGADGADAGVLPDATDVVPDLPDRGRPEDLGSGRVAAQHRPHSPRRIRGAAVVHPRGAAIGAVPPPSRFDAESTGVHVLGGSST